MERNEADPKVGPADPGWDDITDRPLDRWMSVLIDYLDDIAEALIVDDTERALRHLESARDWATSRLDR